MRRKRKLKTNTRRVRHGQGGWFGAHETNYLPSPDDIVQACRLIQEGWTPEQERYRRTGIFNNAKLPNVIPGADKNIAEIKFYGEPITVGLQNARTN